MSQVTGTQVPHGTVYQAVVGITPKTTFALNLPLIALLPVFEMKHSQIFMLYMKHSTLFFSQRLTLSTVAHLLQLAHQCEV